MKIYGKIAVLLSLALYIIMLSIHITYGIDLTDEGYSLSKAWNMINYDFANQTDKIFGTTLINGLWLKLFIKPSLIWARLGQAAVIIGITYYSWKYLYFTLSKSNKKHVSVPLSLLCVIVISIMIIPISLRVINYNSLPYLILLVSIFYLRSSLAPDKIKINSLILSSLGFGILPFFKITYITAWILPFLAIIYFYNSNGLDKTKKPFLIIYLSIFFSVGIVIVLLNFNGFLYNYFCTIIDGLDTLNDSEPAINNHSYKNLINIYSQNLITIGMYIFYVLIVDFGIIVFHKKLHHFYKGNFKKYSESFILINIILILSFLFMNEWQNWYLWISAFTFYFPVRNIFLSDKNNRPDLLFESVILWIIFVISFIGSDNGVYTAFFSMTTVLTTSFVILNTYQTQVDNEELFYLINKKSFLVLILTVFVFLGFFLKNEMNYRDIRFTSIDSSFRSKELSFVQSSVGKTKALDEVIEYLNKKINRKIVFFNSIPIFYFLLDKPMFNSNPWDTLLNEDEYKNFIETAEYDIAVAAYKDPRDKNWPNNKSICWPKDFKKIQFLFNYLNDNGKFRILFQNEMFLIFERVKK